MQSNNQKQSRPHSGRKRKEKKGTRVPHQTLSLTSPEFQDKVTRLDKLMQLAASPTPKAPPGFVLMKDEKGGTLEQVGREADNAWAGVKRIMELLNVEEKYVDYYSAVNVNYTGVLLDLAGSITQGVGRGQRTGDSIKITKVMCHFTMVNAGIGSNYTLVLGTSKDALPSLSDVFALSGATSAQGGLTFPNHYEQASNKVHYTNRGYVLSGAACGNLATEKHEFERKLDNHVMYNTATTTTLSGATWIAAISDVNVTVPVLNYAIRVFFVDN